MKKSSSSGSERRVFPRRTLRTKVVFEDEKGEGFVYFYSTDVSEGGLFFEYDVPLKMGTKIFISFRLPNQQVIQTTGEIVRQASPQNIDISKSGIRIPDAIVGMGIHFIDLDPEKRRMIRDFIQAT